MTVSSIFRNRLKLRKASRYLSNGGGSIVQNLLRLRKAPQFMQGLLFKRIILVFQMGKVGSLSAFFAIERSLGQNWRTSGWSRETRDTILIHIHRFPHHTIWAPYRAMILWRARLGLPLKIICPIREPIARDVSAFFRFFVVAVPGLFNIKNTNLGETEKMFLEYSGQIEPTDHFKDLLYKHPVLANDPIVQHQFGLEWFDKQLRPLTRIDVYKQPFPRDRKWQIYRRGFIRVLVYRVDLERSEQTKLISRFLGIKLDEVGYTNISRSKLYIQFRESTKLPERYIRRMHDSRFAKHFWSQEELKAAADKWRATSSS